ncbi:MAG: RNA-directed DNA polymerase [Maricaulis sp.]|nr:RNA-directed DNA polymerase [Maricaulis sp.]
MNFIEQLTLPENLNFAWRKVKRLVSMADGYYDAAEIAEFEVNLSAELEGIRKRLENGNYRNEKLKPLPRPKKISDGERIDRQYYHIAIRDQVAWVALINVIGPAIDQEMPSWSYGNRLYRPAWYEEDEKDRISALEIGPYRHASGHLYRKFQHSWPLFRRHVALTAKHMVKNSGIAGTELEEADRLAYLAGTQGRLAYFGANFWTPRGQETTLYHAGIDLKQFYPSISIDAVLNGLTSANPILGQDDKLIGLIRSMLSFRLNFDGLPDHLAKNVTPRYLKHKVHGIPTGLFVAGFLANVAIFPVDREVDARIQINRNVAHFRFVDDHTILAYDFDELCEWIEWYEKLLLSHKIGPAVNADKYDPPSLRVWLKDRQKKLASAEFILNRHHKNRDTAISETKLDGRNPTKLLTKTLAQVSEIAMGNIDVLDDGDIRTLLTRLEWLLLAEIPDRELRADTRAAFAAGQIARLATTLIEETDGLVEASREVASLRAKLRNETAKTKTGSIKLRLHIKTAKYVSLQNEYRDAELKRLTHVFGLLFQAFKEFPAKAQLYHRLHQFCRLTGYHGITQIADWIGEQQDQGHHAWAEYYAGLTLQILGSSSLVCAKNMISGSTLRSEKSASQRHLEEIATLSPETFGQALSSVAWFHKSAQTGFSMSLRATASTLEKHPKFGGLAKQLSQCAANNLLAQDGKIEVDCLAATGYSAGVWAHRAEQYLSSGEEPSEAWTAMVSNFDFSLNTDVNAARRYPKKLSDSAWVAISKPDVLKKNDAGWVREAIGDRADRLHQAKLNRGHAFTYAVGNIAEMDDTWISLSRWVQDLKKNDDPFDPRRSEWTALEIIRLLLQKSFAIDESKNLLDAINPNNIFLPLAWSSHRPHELNTWENWRAIVTENGELRISEGINRIADYRFRIYESGIRDGSPWEGYFHSIGRLLLGLLVFDFRAPPIWNIRGNEQAVPFPIGEFSQQLAVSTSTLKILQSALEKRSAETRSFNRMWSLFGWPKGVPPNDIDFDPPTLEDPNQVVAAIDEAQRNLIENQISVSNSQPRQLIPVRLSGPVLGVEDGDAELDPLDGQ